MCRYNRCNFAEARLHTETDGRSAIRLRFECPEKVDWRKAGIDKVAIFLNARVQLAQRCIWQ